MCSFFSASQVTQRGGGGRSHQSCEVCELKSGCQSAVTDSVVMKPLFGQSAREHRAVSSEAPQPEPQWARKHRRILILKADFSIKYVCSSPLESVDLVVGHPALLLCYS